MKRVIEYQVNQHDKDGDIFNCVRCDSLDEAMLNYQGWKGLVGMGEGRCKIAAVTVEKVTIIKEPFRIDDAEYEVVMDSAVELARP